MREPQPAEAETYWERPATQEQLAAGGGVFAIYSPHRRWQDAPAYAFHGARGIQGRGESINHMAFASSQGDIEVFGNDGLVSSVYVDRTLRGVIGRSALVHLSDNSDKRDRLPKDAQEHEMFVDSIGNHTFSVSFDGAIQYESGGQYDGSARSLSDHIGKEVENGHKIDQAVLRVLRSVHGAFSMAVLDSHSLMVARDRHGTHPLYLGDIPKHGTAVASDGVAISQIGGVNIREVEPGTMVHLTRRHQRVYEFATPQPAHCVYNFVHLARRGGEFAGQSVEAGRYNCGVALAKRDADQGIEADVIFGVPETSHPFVAGYAEASGVRAEVTGIIRNRYDYPNAGVIPIGGRARSTVIKAAFSVVGELINGKRCVVIDDSSSGGTTREVITQKFLNAGALEVHWREALPPQGSDCIKGVGTGQPKTFLIKDIPVAERKEYIRRTASLTSYDHLDLETLAGCFGQDANSLCTDCIQ